ncbi:MAG: hypothetical protein NC118_03475 [Eubacterium sp.]|nr:hypothetical protein [Eubacterium sp.]
MVKKKKTWIFIGSLVVLLMVGGDFFVREIQRNLNIKNVFDEMIAKKYIVMEDAEHIAVGGYDAVRLLWPVKERTPLKIGIIYSKEYQKLYIYGDACMPEEIENMSYQEYFEECLKKYDITWEEVEDRKEDFICKSILETWFIENESLFSKDRLGELEVIDFLMPYEYCGKDNSKWKTVTEIVEEGYRGTFQGKIVYTVWDAEALLCRQTQKHRDYGFRDIMERIEADMNAFNTVSEDIVVEWYGRWERMNEEEREFDSLADVFSLECHNFVDWLRTSGKVEGNLTKLSYTREEGEAKTQEILEQYPSSELFRMLEIADYYIAGDELNIRLACYDYEADNPGWLENGKGEVWQGWITLKIDDIREFLSGDGFYIDTGEKNGVYR